MCVVRARFHLVIVSSLIFVLLDAENPMSRTSTSVYLDIDRETPPLNQLNKNLTCSSLQDCHNRGQCISINNQLKCLYVSRIHCCHEFMFWFD